MKLAFFDNYKLGVVVGDVEPVAEGDAVLLSVVVGDAVPDNVGDVEVDTVDVAVGVGVGVAVRDGFACLIPGISVVPWLQFLPELLHWNECPLISSIPVTTSIVTTKTASAARAIRPHR